MFKHSRLVIFLLLRMASFLIFINTLFNQKRKDAIMKEKNKQLDFTGIKLFIGIDVHKNSWTITIRTNEIALKTYSMNPSPKELYRHLQKYYPNAEYYSVYEAGFCGFWIHRELINFGINSMVTNPADVPTKHKERRRRRDKVDSRKLARELAKGSLDSIYTPTKEQEALKALSRRRYQIRKRTTQIKNRIKQFLYNRGFDIPQKSEISHWSGRFIHWLKSIKFDQPNDWYYLNSQLIDLENERKQMKNVLKTIRELPKNNSIIQYLKSVPGVGLITAFTFYAEIMDIKRFKNLDHLAAFIGLVPDIEASGEKTNIKGLTKRYQKYLRSLLIEAAWIASANDPALTLALSNLCKKKIKQKAIIKITKKLVNRLRSVWINQQEYVYAVVQ